MAAPQRVATLNRPNMVSVGTIVFLSQELMFFAGLFAMYFVSRANGQGDSWDWGTGHLNVPYALLITVILVSSSFTAQWGVFAAERGDVFALRKWYALSTALGAYIQRITRSTFCVHRKSHPHWGNWKNTILNRAEPAIN